MRAHHFVLLIVTTHIKESRCCCIPSKAFDLANPASQCHSFSMLIKLLPKPNNFNHNVLCFSKAKLSNQEGLNLVWFALSISMGHKTAWFHAKEKIDII